MSENYIAEAHKRVTFAARDDLVPEPVWTLHPEFEEAIVYPERNERLPAFTNEHLHQQTYGLAPHDPSSLLDFNFSARSGRSRGALFTLPEDEGEENTPPADVSAFGLVGADNLPQTEVTWNREPFAWNDRFETHQATNYLDSQSSWRPSDHYAMRNQQIMEHWDQQSDYSWREGDYERPRSPNWNAQPTSWAERQPSQVAGQGSQNSRLVLPDDFLDLYPKGNATITFQGDDDEIDSIHSLDPDIIGQRCPILALAFEESRSGPQLFLETLSTATALPFIRFLYTGAYEMTNPQDSEDVPTSLLFHFQLYRLGDIYDLEELKRQAKLNVFRQCEYGCCAPDKPIDLCAAIRFYYERIAKVDNIFSNKHEALINNVIDYCVTCFVRHQLANDPMFKDLAFELRPFHQSLSVNIRERNYDPPEIAQAIIRLPFKTFAPETYASRDDVVYQFHAYDELDNATKKRKRVLLPPTKAELQAKELAVRPRPSIFDITPKPTYDDTTRGVMSKRRASATEQSADSAPVVIPVDAGMKLPLRLAEMTKARDEGWQKENTAKKPEEHARFIAKAQTSRLTALLSDAKATSETNLEESKTAFEPLPPPAKTEPLSDSDSDESFVRIKHEDVEAEDSGSTSRSTKADEKSRTSSDSDSDWELM